MISNFATSFGHDWVKFLQMQEKYIPQAGERKDSWVFVVTFDKLDSYWKS